MQDATAENENLAAEPASSNADVAARLSRIEAELGVVGTALDLASQLHVENTELLKRVVTAVEALQSPTP